MTAACTAGAVTVCKVILDILNSPASILMIVLVIMAARQEPHWKVNMTAQGRFMSKKFIFIGILPTHVMLITNGFFQGFALDMKW